MRGEDEASLAWALRHSGLMLIILVFTIILNGILYYFVPKGFFPQQDVGRMIGPIQADQGISFQAMREKLSDFAEIVKSHPAAENVVGLTSRAQRTSGFIVITITPA